MLKTWGSSVMLEPFEAMTFGRNLQRRGETLPVAPPPRDFTNVVNVSFAGNVCSAFQNEENDWFLCLFRGGPAYV